MNQKKIFQKKINLFLNPNYFSNMYTTIVLKVEEVDKTLVAKKNELKK